MLAFVLCATTIPRCSERYVTLHGACQGTMKLKNGWEKKTGRRGVKRAKVYYRGFQDNDDWDDAAVLDKNERDFDDAQPQLLSVRWDFQFSQHTRQGDVWKTTSADFSFPSGCRRIDATEMLDQSCLLDSENTFTFKSICVNFWALTSQTINGCTVCLFTFFPSRVTKLCFAFGLFWEMFCLNTFVFSERVIFRHVQRDMMLAEKQWPQSYSNHNEIPISWEKSIWSGKGLRDRWEWKTIREGEVGRIWLLKETM